MTTLVFAADVHVGNHKRFGGALVAGLNERGRLSVDALGLAARRADALGADLFVLGDLFDDDRPNPQIISAVQREVSLVSAHLLVGNHDQTSDAPEHHALAPLRLCANVVDLPVVVRYGTGQDAVEVGLVPFRPVAALEYLPAAVAALEWKNPHARRILGIHAGIKDEATPPWLRDSKDAIDVDVLAQLAVGAGIGTVMCGNWHHYQRWSITRGRDRTSIVQIGSLCPTGFDDLSPAHGVAVWEDGEVTFEDVVGPRFAKVSNKREFLTAVANHVEHRLYVSWTAPSDGLADATILAESTRATAPHLAAVEVLPDGKALEAQTREAAVVARSAGALVESMGAYVDAMPLPVGVDRAEVLSRAKDYL